jgi:hypothetical protein
LFYLVPGNQETGHSVRYHEYTVRVARKVGPVTAPKDMIFVLILIAWLTIVAIIVNACRSAARGDELLSRESSDAPRRRSTGALWQEGPGLVGAHQLRLAHVGELPRRGTRVRGGCATGS